MDTPTLQSEAEKLLDKMTLGPPREAGEKLRPGDELRILQLSDEGRTQEEIAAAVECHQSTVSRVIAKHVPTLELAKTTLAANAQKAADRVVELMSAEGKVGLEASEVHVTGQWHRHREGPDRRRRAGGVGFACESASCGTGERAAT